MVWAAMWVFLGPWGQLATLNRCPRFQCKHTGGDSELGRRGGNCEVVNFNIVCFIGVRMFFQCKYRYLLLGYFNAVKFSHVVNILMRQEFCRLLFELCLTSFAYYSILLSLYQYSLKSVQRFSRKSKLNKQTNSVSH